MRKKLIYGISWKYNWGWTHYIVAFGTRAEAEEWLDTEEYDFRERELCTKTEAIKKVGKQEVENAEYRYYNYFLIVI